MSWRLVKTLQPCARIRSTFASILAFSAASISATLATESTLTFEP